MKNSSFNTAISNTIERNVGQYAILTAITDLWSFHDLTELQSSRLMHLKNDVVAGAPVVLERYLILEGG